jgi:hypothetical protein
MVSVSTGFILRTANGLLTCSQTTTLSSGRERQRRQDPHRSKQEPCELDVTVERSERLHTFMESPAPSRVHRNARDHTSWTNQTSTLAVETYLASLDKYHALETYLASSTKYQAQKTYLASSNQYQALETYLASLNKYQSQETYLASSNKCQAQETYLASSKQVPSPGDISSTSKHLACLKKQQDCSQETHLASSRVFSTTRSWLQGVRKDQPHRPRRCGGHMPPATIPHPFAKRTAPTTN